ncbi:hypothetical protein LTR53_007515 [Teratosphaeriaceae sp. CCFEE 6253]|nr:hypothetical protein LTR53_007515 [Teratosphaeriaceae sp. CCFEE 6253]
MPNALLAVIPNQTIDNNGSNYKAAHIAPQHAKASPRDLILHESISHLVTEVTELRVRCGGLEASNKQLAACVEGTRNGLCNSPCALSTRTLAGYASSASSTIAAEEEGAADDDKHEQRFQAVAGILEEYDERITTQKDQQIGIETRIAELTAYARSSQALFAALKTELNGLEETPKLLNEGFTGVRKVSNEAITALADKHDGMGKRIELLEQDLKELSANADRKHLTAKFKTQQPSNGDNTLPQTAEQRLKKLEGTMTKVVEYCKKAEAKAKQEQRIDDAATKDALYRIFADITGIMVSTDDNVTRRCGDFHGTFDELWPLRSRVVLRLAAFDAYGAAFEEARTAELA